MSGTIVSLRRKIDGANNLRSVVRTMKAVSASNVGQYEDSVRSLADYYHSVALGLGACLRAKTRKAVLTDSKESSKRNIAVVFGSDQGLVGKFNATISDFAIKTLSQVSGTVQVWAVGERVHEYMAASSLTVSNLFSLPSSIKGIVPLVDSILLEREARGAWAEDSGLYLFYNRPQSSEVYSPIVQRLLPFDQQWLQELQNYPWPSKKYAQIVGEDAETLRALINEYLFISLFRACAESLASENASRLAAMERADQNIDELLQEHNETYHRLRKEGIDAELFDVIASAYPESL